MKVWDVTSRIPFRNLSVGNPNGLISRQHAILILPGWGTGLRLLGYLTFFNSAMHCSRNPSLGRETPKLHSGGLGFLYVGR